YASLTASGWSVQTVDTNASQPVLALDSNNNPHIMYQSSSMPFTIKYAVWNQSSWEIQTVTNNYYLDQMILDSKGYPHFLCQNLVIKNNVPIYSDSSTLKYVSWNGHAWN